MVRQPLWPTVWSSYAPRYTHVATLRMRDASERMSRALWSQG